MRKIYFKILIGIVFLLWIIYFIQFYNNNQEAFTPRIRGLYRPYIRHINRKYESLVDNYGYKVIINKLRKWNIY